MADPLSVAASIIAIVGAADKVLNGLDRAWQLRYRDQQFLDLRNQIMGIRMQLRAVTICLPALEKCDANTELFADALRDIKAQSIQATALLGNLDRAIQDLMHKGKDNRRSILLKPSKRNWLKRQTETVRLMSQVNTIIEPLTATLTLLQTHITNILPRHSIASSSQHFVIQNIAVLDESTDIENASTDATAIEVQLETAVRALQDTELYKRPFPSIPGTGSVPLSSMDGAIIANSPDNSPAGSFYTAHSHRSSVVSKLFTITGTLGSEPCKRFCPCQCHIPRQVRTPVWAKQFLGSITFAGNASLLLNRRPCNKRFCGRSGTTSMQFTYAAPAWAFLKVFSVEGKAQGIRGWNSSWSICMPRVISTSALVWGYIDRGMISRIEQAFAAKLSSPYDVDKYGQTLLHAAAMRNQMYIYRFLMRQGAPSQTIDSFGMTPSHHILDISIPGRVLPEHQLLEATSSMSDILDEHFLDEQGFTLLHRIIIGLHGMDLKTYLDDISLDIDKQDANGRTPLFWAARMGQSEKVELLLQAGAKVDQSDFQGSTPLIEAVWGGGYQHLHCVRLLLEAKASVAPVDCRGWMPIHYACCVVMAPLCFLRTLVEQGADITSRTRSGHSTLHLAAYHGHRDSIDYLLSLGLDIDDMVGINRTPIGTALEGRQWKSFRHLANLGADLGLVERDGITILHLVVIFAPVQIWHAVIDLARKGRLENVDTRAKHTDHDIWGCYHKCREDGFVWVRDMDEEEETLKALLEAIQESQSK